MARYIVDSQIDNHEKYYFIREQESQDIVLLPSKYLMHKKRSKLSPNTIRRSAGAISYYLNYIDETGIQLDDVWEIDYMPKRIEQANKEYFNQAENLLATGIIPKKRGEKTGK